MAILHENTVKAIGKDNDVAQAAFDKYVDAVCVKISQAVNECWQEKSRQLTTEAVNLSNRLLATKFVADEAVGLVKELERALKNIAGFDHFISEERARGVFIANVYPAIAKAATFTAANANKDVLVAPKAIQRGKLLMKTLSTDEDGNEFHTKVSQDGVDVCDILYFRDSYYQVEGFLHAIADREAETAANAPTSPTVGGETETKIFPPVDVVAEFVPDWTNISARFPCVAVDADGKVFAYESNPIYDSSCWRFAEHTPFNKRDFYLVSKISPPPGDTWKQMIYQRPK